MKYCSLYTKFLIFFCAIFISEKSVAQNEEIGFKKPVYIDEQGIMRWGHNHAEVKGFGVNYTAPFAHAFRTAEKLDVDLKKAINNDVYHLTRLGFDLYRVHVWDTEISDAQGNLLENEHLELFDYLIKQLKDHGFNFVITPIAYWGNGWPEPDEDTPGFSNKYGKANSLTNPKAIAAQQNYLKQFLNHVNPYTGFAYKNAPHVIAFEVSNEPHHRGKPEDVKKFINGMVSAMRSTGTQKPLFYNTSHSVHLAETYFSSKIQGGTFQWYPTGLGYGREIGGNLLPNVSKYPIPFNEIIKKEGAAKLVYEFDAANVMKAYMYPFMARSFRETGMQLATYFAYDPTFMAAYNTEYNNHYMNLAYTPQSALGLMIAEEVFKQIPMYQDFGPYPNNLDFGPFSVSYEQNLATLNLPEKFIYTNHNKLTPVQSSELKQIAGYGNSKVVKYEGKGAYFLDKLKPGLWRLEVMPDAILVNNPFGTNSLKKEVTVINWKEWQMQLQLPQLGVPFKVIPINEGNDFVPQIQGNTFTIWPGTYLIVSEGTSHDFSNDKIWNNHKLNSFFAPKTTVKKTYVVHEPYPEVVENTPFTISAKIVSNEEIKKVEIWFQNNNTYKRLELRQKQGYSYSVEVPSELLKNGFLNYRIVVFSKDNSHTFPGGIAGSPGDWDFYNKKTYETRIVNKDHAITIFNPVKDAAWVQKKWLPTIKTVPAKETGKAEYQVFVKSLYNEDQENKNANPIYNYAFKFYFGDKIKGRTADLKNKSQLVLKGRSLLKKPQKLQVALVMKNGASFGKTITLSPEMEVHEIQFSELVPVKTVLLPRPYPTFLPYFFEHELSTDFNRTRIESIQFSIGPGINKKALKASQGVGIISVRLE